MSRVLIVSKTKMSNGKVCIGGLDLDNCRSVRLMDANGHHETAGACPYNIYDVWDLNYRRVSHRELPHSAEDVNIITRQQCGNLQGINLANYVTQYGARLYRNSILNCFDGKLQSSRSGTFFIARNDVPNHSTCFWICDTDLRRDDYETKIRYKFKDGIHRWGGCITYVGLDTNIPDVIKQGTLLRLSLAHWWSPEDSDVEERCYLQLSGIF